MKKLIFSFDIGYASIGWAAILSGAEPRVLGTGVVLFPKDDCLASQRRGYRRQRRTIRARRQRIHRIGCILEHYGLITAEQRRLPGHSAPFHLAARALEGKVQLSGLELWHLLRWYAHNRGYDGNSRWASQDTQASKEDTQKVMAARKAMDDCGTTTMAETLMGILRLKTGGKQASTRAFKTLSMAFPREVVENEVNRLLEHSVMPAELRPLIVGDVHEHQDRLLECQVRMPRRYEGSVLFGQLVPRFDNRIIARCPIIWAREYAQAIAEGLNEKVAHARATKYAKVPNADCPEFYLYRFARILCNIRVNNQPLTAEHRQALMKLAKQQKRFTKTSFKNAVGELIGDAPNNLRQFFQIHPDSDKALIVVPSKDEERAPGRAPYARPVLRQVVQEVLRGEDPTRPARCLAHPDGEVKDLDGVLYALSDPESDVSRLQASRSVEEMSNNHLVRHRMLIFKRLLRDMTSRYAEGDPDLVGQVCIEVGRELSEFSGKTAKEIESELGKRLKNFKDAVKKLEEYQKSAPGFRLSAGLIRKCRIAMDLNWTCPYTGATYCVRDLPHLEREHVVPFSGRNSNSMASLVLTWPEVNKMKGNRTGLQFVQECQGMGVTNGKEHLSIMTPKRYEKFVASLDTRKGSPDDQHRKKRRKQLMMVEALSSKVSREDGLGFTDGMMTQSSHLMKIARHVAKGLCPKARMLSIPGAVTAAVRSSWKAWGLLAEVCPGVVNDSSGMLMDKESIRGVTHLHHAVDACVLGLIPVLVPGGHNGIVWQALALRRLSASQMQRVRELSANGFVLDNEGRMHLNALPPEVKESMVNALGEERVVTHVPADMSGAKLEETTWGVLKVENGVATLRQRKRTVRSDGTRAQEMKQDTPLIQKILGVREAADSKLRAQKGARVICENYGLTLTPEPVVIPHHNVYNVLE